MVGSELEPRSLEFLSRERAIWEVTEPGHFILFWDRWDPLEIKPLTLCHVGLCRVGEVKTAMPSHRYRRIGRVS